MHDLLLVLRISLRSLRRSPAFTSTALATLAIGIGLTTAIFSLVEATLLKPLPFADADRLAQVWESQSERGAEQNVVNPGNFLDWKERARSFSRLVAFAPWTANLAGDAAAEQVPITYATEGFLEVLGASPRLGRGFVPADFAPGAADVVLLSESLWRARYAADASIVGREILLNGSPATVVGVLPGALDFPVGSQLWAPLELGERARAHPGRYLQVIGRLAPGATLAGAGAEMRAIAAQLAVERPDFDAGWSASVIGLREQLFGEYRRALWVLFAATGVVLLLVCTNLSGLLLARNAGRRQELAVRGALGADRRHLARHLLVESALLALGGGILALGVARAALVLLRHRLPIELPAFVTPSMDARVLGFALSLTAACVLTFGLLPAFSGSRAALADPMREGGVRTLGRRGSRARGTLVVAEVALSLALVSASGLLVRSLTTLRAVDPGFRASQLLTARVSLNGPSYRDPARAADFFRRLEEKLAGGPGVETVGAISWLPLGGAGSATSYRAVDRPVPAPGEDRVADVRMVTPGFFRAAGVQLLAGRLTGPEDDAQAPPVVVINEFAARELWPGEDPVGREIAMEWGESRTARVVGVISDLHLTKLDVEPRATLFWPLAQLPNNFMSILIRTAGDPALAAGTLRRAVADLDPTIPAAQVATMDEVIARGTGRQRFISALLLLFAALGLTLSALGLYGLLATAVAERRREMGLRMALGADRRRLLAEVIRGGLATVAIGLVVGAPLALAAGRALGALLYRTSPADPATLVAAPLILLAVGALAAAIPAARAAGVDPAQALREG